MSKRGMGESAVVVFTASGRRRKPQCARLLIKYGEARLP